MQEAYYFQIHDFPSSKNMNNIMYKYHSGVMISTVVWIIIICITSLVVKV